jgi:hypothetical protein
LIKGTCEAAVPVGTDLGIFGGVDMVLESSGNSPIFIPTIGAALNKVIGSKIALDLYTEKRAIYKELSAVEKMNQVWKENLEFTKLFSDNVFFSDENRKEKMDSFTQDKAMINAKRSELMDELKKNNGKG